jgi:hypothetical protein
MKSIKKIGSKLYVAAFMLFMPLLTMAQSDPVTKTAIGGSNKAGDNFDPTKTKLGGWLDSVLVFINEILIPFIFGIGFLVFVWGMFQYFIAGGDNDEAKEKGKSLMIYAVLGFVLIIVFWGVVNMLAGSTGLNENFDAKLTPDAIDISGI